MNNPYKIQKFSGKLGKHLQKSILKKFTPKEVASPQKFTLKTLEDCSPGYLKCTENSNIREYMIASSLGGDKKLTKEQLAELEAQVQEQRGKFMRRKDKMGESENSWKGLEKNFSKNKDCNVINNKSLHSGSTKSFRKRKKRVSKGAKSQKTAGSSGSVLDPENNAIYISNRLQNSQDELSLKGLKQTRKGKKSKKPGVEKSDLDCPKTISDSESSHESPLARSKSPSERTLNKYLQVLLAEKNGVNAKERSLKGKSPQDYEENLKSVDSKGKISAQLLTKFLISF